MYRKTLVYEKSSDKSKIFRLDIDGWNLNACEVKTIEIVRGMLEKICSLELPAIQPGTKSKIIKSQSKKDAKLSDM